MSFRSSALALASALLLNSCATPPPPVIESGAPSGMDAWTTPLRQVNRGLSDTTSTAGATIPLLGSPTLAREWGAPAISKSADGSFRLRYMPKGKLDGLICYSLTAPLPNPASPPAWEEPNGGPLDEKPSTMHPQQWRQAKVAGHAVNWFQQDGGGGADFPVFTTVCFTHTDSASRTGHYVVQAWSDSPENAATLLAKAAFLSGR